MPKSLDKLGYIWSSSPSGAPSRIKRMLRMFSLQLKPYKSPDGGLDVRQRGETVLMIR